MKNTDKLKSDLIKLEADTSELEDKVNSVDNCLISVHDKLAIPERLHDRLSTLDSNLKVASDLLGIMRIIPPISAGASNTKKTFTGDRLVSEVQALQARLHSLFEFTDAYQKVYQACVHGKVERTDMAAPLLAQHQAEMDPNLFDATVTMKERTYIFQGDNYWLHTSGQDEAAGPFPISSEFGRDHNKTDLGSVGSGLHSSLWAGHEKLILLCAEFYFRQFVGRRTCLN